MIITLTQTFHAKWKLHNHSETATYEIEISIEGPARTLMTDVSPIVEEIKALEGVDLSEKIGRSSLEAIAIHIREVTKKYVDIQDHIKSIILTENGFFKVVLDNSD